MQARIATFRRPADQASITTNDLLDARYEVMEEVGQGGLAQVFAAHDLKLNRPRAVKALRPEYATQRPDIVLRFQEQIKLASRLAQLDPEHFPEIHDAVYATNSACRWVVMDLLEGQNLGQLMEGSEAPISPLKALKIAEQVLTAIMNAHRAGITLNNLKPENIFIESNGRVKLLDPEPDLGDNEEDETLWGTLGYISPERLIGLASSAQSDLYSFGVTLHEMLTGEIPFAQLKTTEMATAHVKKAIPLAPMEQLPIPLRDYILWMLSKNPQERPDSTESALGELRAIQKILTQRAHVKERAEQALYDHSMLPFLRPYKVIGAKEETYRNWMQEVDDFFNAMTNNDIETVLRMIKLDGKKPRQDHLQKIRTFLNFPDRQLSESDTRLMAIGLFVLGKKAPWKRLPNIGKLLIGGTMRMEKIFSQKGRTNCKDVCLLVKELASFYGIEGRIIGLEKLDHSYFETSNGRILDPAYGRTRAGFFEDRSDFLTHIVNNKIIPVPKELTAQSAPAS